MATSEKLEATYVVRYFVDLPEIPPQNDKLPKMDFTQAINVASRWIKDDRQIDIMFPYSNVYFVKYLAKR